MIVLTLDPIDPGSCGSHISTDWQVATDSNFTNIINESLNDATNLLTYTFNYQQVVPKLFGRARVNFDSCTTDWLVITLSDEPVITNIIQRPSLSLLTNSQNEVYLDGGPFTLTAGSGETHVSSDWEIKDKFNNILLSNYNDVNNLESLVIPDGLLVQGETYGYFVRYNGNTTRSNFAGLVARYNQIEPIIETPTPSPAQPDGYIPETPTLVATPFTLVQGSDIHVSTTWRLWQQEAEALPGQGLTLLFESVQDTNNLESISPGIALDPNFYGEYYIEVIYHGANVSSGVGRSTNFVPEYFWIDQAYPTIEGYPNDVDQSPLVSIGNSYFYNLPPGETISTILWEIENQATNAIEYSTTTPYGTNNNIQVPDGTLTVGDDYYFLVTLISTSGNYGSTGLRSVNNIVPDPGPIDVFTVTVDGAPNNVRQGPYITTSGFVSNVGSNHVSTTWRLTDVVNNIVIWESINDTQNLETIKVPNNTLPVGTTHIVAFVEYTDDQGNTQPSIEDIYTVITGEGWQYFPSSALPGNTRRGFGVAHLDNNSWLVFSGVDGSNNPVSDVAIYDLINNVFTVEQNVVNPYPTSDPLFTKLDDGRIFVYGGYSDVEAGITQRAYIIDNKNLNNWNRVSDLNLLPGTTAGIGGASIVNLGNNRIMIVGGYGYPNGAFAYLDTTFIYDANTDTWSNGPALPYSGRGFAAAVMPNGDLFIAGGNTGFGSVVSTSYSYSFTTNTWTQLPDCFIAINAIQTYLLDNDRISIFFTPNLDNSLLYHINDNIWTYGRYRTTTINWSDFTGITGQNTENGSIFYLNLNSSYYGGALHYTETIKIEDPTVTLEGYPNNVQQDPIITTSPFNDLSNQVNLYSVYYNIVDTNDISVYNKTTFLSTPDPFTIKVYPYTMAPGDTYTLEVTHTGFDLTTGNRPGHTSAIQKLTFVNSSPAFTFTWNLTAPHSDGNRRAYGLTANSNGDVVMSGGQPAGLSNTLDTVLIYSTVNDNWSLSSGLLPEPRMEHRQILISSGNLVIIGGYNGSNSNLDTVAISDITVSSWSNLSLSNPSGVLIGRRAFALSALPNDKVLVTGGDRQGVIFLDYLDSGYVLDLVNNAISPIANLPYSLHRHAQVTLPNGNVLIIGGQTVLDPSNSLDYITRKEIYEYDIINDSWSLFDTLPFEFYSHSAVLLKDNAGNDTDEIALISGSGDTANWVAIYNYINKTLRYETKLPNDTRISLAGLINTNKLFVSKDIYGNHSDFYYQT